MTEPYKRNDVGFQRGERPKAAAAAQPSIPKPETVSYRFAETGVVLTLNDRDIPSDATVTMPVSVITRFIESARDSMRTVIEATQPALLRAHEQGTEQARAEGYVAGYEAAQAAAPVRNPNALNTRFEYEAGKLTRVIRE